MHSCPGDQTIGAFVAGRVTARARKQLEGHLDGCEECTHLVTALVSRLPAFTRPSRKAASVGESARIVEWLHGHKLRRYIFLDDVGEIGTGTVYAAYDNLLDRKVGLRFLPGADGSQTALTQVLAEGGAIAKLSHPNVVRIHDVGQLDGLPYLSTELVEGVTLTVWRVQAPRSFGEIAAVMAAAARGLAAAHGAGIVHRDVTPQHILVHGSRVLVADFGLPVGGDGETDGADAGAGSLAYRAPEQLRGERVDARTDVFGFCATLYEMIHGRPPFAGTSIEEVLAQVMAGRVARPSPRSRAPAHLAGLALRGLDPDPARRPDMNRLASELLADPAPRWRNGALAVAATAVVIGAFSVGAYLKGNPERRCRMGAEVISGIWNDGRRGQLRERYAAAGQQAIWPLLERRLGDFAGGWRASYGEACATAHGKLSRSDTGLDVQIPCLQAQRATMEALVGAVSSGTTAELVRAAGAVLPDPSSCRLAARSEPLPLPADPQLRARLAAVEQSVAVAHAAELLGDYPAAADTAGKAIESARKLGYQPVLASALVRLASIEVARAGNRTSERPAGLDQAAALLTDAYAVAEAGHDDGHRLTAATEQVVVHTRRGQYAEALRWARLAEALVARLGDPPSEAAALALNLGWVELYQGEKTGAAAAFARSLELSRKIQPPDERRQAQVARSLCTTMLDDVKLIACFRQALAMARAAYGEHHPDLGRFYTNLSTALAPFVSTRPESCALLQKAVAVQEPSLDPASPSVILSLVDLADCHVDAGEIAQAEQVYVDALARQPGRSDRAPLFESYGTFLCDHGDLAAGLRYLRAALADFDALVGPAHEHTLRVRLNLALTLQEHGRVAEATRQIDEGADFCRRRAVDNFRCASFVAQQGLDFQRQKRFPAAIRAFQEALQITGRSKNEEHDDFLAEYGLGVTYMALKSAAEAIPHLERALALRPATTTLSYAQLARAATASALAQALTAVGRDRRRPCELAGEAAAIYRAAIPRERRVHLPQTERWLAHHGCPAHA
jgi:tetratricopeptide (TPR) repeat protein